MEPRSKRLLVINQAAFQNLITCSPSAHLAILRTVTARLRSTESMLVQNDKMAALGALTDTRQAEVVTALHERIMGRTAAPIVADPLAPSDQEIELEERMEDEGIESVWELAPVLVSFGWDRDELEQATESFASDQRAVVLRWLAAGSSVYGLLGEVGASANAISETAKAVKTYSYLDQAPVQNVDVGENLEILRTKIKDGISVTREYAEDGGVVVEIIDNGPGISPEDQRHIFDPFFTTKEPGVGTGLGLHIAYNIIVNKHYGQTQVSSSPIEICFRVDLPVWFARE